MDRGGDRLAILLDAEPDGDRFDLEIRSQSPANGVVPALLGTNRVDRPPRHRRRQLDRVARDCRAQHGGTADGTPAD